MNPLHVAGGAMHIEKPIYHNQLFDAFFKASLEKGIQPNADFKRLEPHPRGLRRLSGKLLFFCIADFACGCCCLCE